MSQPNFLIDTNVFIELEGQQQVGPNFSLFLKLAQRHSVGVFIHEAAKDDIARAIKTQIADVSHSPKLRNFN